jgi:hypothetical protein
MNASREKKAIHAARRAYKSAMAVGAEERIALDVACAAYRVAHPVMSGRVIQKVVAGKLGNGRNLAKTAGPSRRRA